MMWKEEALSTARMQIGVAIIENRMEVPQELKIELVTYDSALPLLCIHPFEEMCSLQYFLQFSRY